MLYKQIISNYLLDYLKLKKVPMKKSGKIIMLTCPFCKKEPMSASILLTVKHKMHCYNCKKSYGIIAVYNELRSDKNITKTEEQVLNDVKKQLNIKVITKTDEINIDKYLDFYVENGFDLVPIVNNGKIPIEKDWTNKTHKDKEEWQQWLVNNLNLGVKTGKVSGVTIIDIDQKPIPEEIKKIMGNVLIQESTNGFHLFYKYESELPKTRIAEFKIDLENNGGQVVCTPSKIKNKERKFLNFPTPVIQMPKELLELFKSKVTIPRKTNSEKIREDIETEDFKIKPEDFKLKDNNLEGCCNSSFIKLGGILRKELNFLQTKFVLHIFNKHLLEDPMKPKVVNAMIQELNKYTIFDEKELAHKIIEYMKDVEEANRTEIAMAVAGTNRGEDKKRVDKALKYLVKEGYLLKKGRSYSILKKVEWVDTLLDTVNPIDFKMPYFYNVSNFNFGDLILIGSKNKRGKTHIAMNIIKRLVKQGIKPCYISLESGSRAIKIALQLGLKDGDFKRPKHIIVDPTKIELEPNAITIIDWLCPLNFAEVDKLFMHFIEQLDKTNGILIVFMQLKGSKIQNNEWFAPNLVSQFPALVIRYIYDNEDSGEFGKFVVDFIRDPKLRIKSYELPARYDWETKELKLVSEIEQEKKTKGE